MNLITREPSRFLIVINPRLEGALVTPLEVAPPATLKARTSSSTSHSITFEGLSNNQVSGSKICIFYNWEVTKGVFEDFIHPVDMDWVLKEGNQQ